MLNGVAAAPTCCSSQMAVALTRGSAQWPRGLVVVLALRHVVYLVRVLLSIHANASYASAHDHAHRDISGAHTSLFINEA